MNLVGGWALPLWKSLVNWDDDFQYVGRWKMIQTTNQSMNLCLYPGTIFTTHKNHNLTMAISSVFRAKKAPVNQRRFTKWWCIWYCNPLKRQVPAICPICPISIRTPDSNLPFLVSSLTLCASPACCGYSRTRTWKYSWTETPLLGLPENQPI